MPGTFDILSSVLRPNTHYALQEVHAFNEDLTDQLQRKDAELAESNAKLQESLRTVVTLKEDAEACEIAHQVRAPFNLCTMSILIATHRPSVRHTHSSTPATRTQSPPFKSNFAHSRRLTRRRTTSSPRRKTGRSTTRPPHRSRSNPRTTRRHVSLNLRISYAPPSRTRRFSSPGPRRPSRLHATRRPKPTKLVFVLIRSRRTCRPGRRARRA